MTEAIQISFDIATAASIFLTGLLSGIFLKSKYKKQEENDMKRLKLSKKMSFLDSLGTQAYEIEREIEIAGADLDVVFATKDPNLIEKKVKEIDRFVWSGK